MEADFKESMRILAKWISRIALVLTVLGLALFGVVSGFVYMYKNYPAFL